jgi:hypothetical protein
MRNQVRMLDDDIGGCPANRAKSNDANSNLLHGHEKNPNPSGAGY